MGLGVLPNPPQILCQNNCPQRGSIDDHDDHDDHNDHDDHLDHDDTLHHDDHIGKRQLGVRQGGAEIF